MKRLVKAINEVKKRYEQDEIPKIIKGAKGIAPEVVRLREQDFATVKCETCRYWEPKSKNCKVLVIDVEATQTCDAFQGLESGFKKYNIGRERIESFKKGIIKSKALNLKVFQSLLSPVGWLLLIKDGLNHIYSLELNDFVDMTSMNNGWMQDEVEKIIKSGKEG